VVGWKKVGGFCEVRSVRPFMPSDQKASLLCILHTSRTKVYREKAEGKPKKRGKA